MRMADIKQFASIVALAGLLAATPVASASGAPPRSISLLATPRPVFTGKQIAVWIGQLSSPHAAIRRQAKRELIAAGTVAVGPVKAALAGWTTPQMRVDMRAVLGSIDLATARRGPLVTLKLAHAPLGIILKRLCIQAGLDAKFSGTSPRWATRRVTIDVQRQPFWKVMQRIAWLTDVSPTGTDYYGGGLFTFAHPGAFDKRTPMDCHGALLLAVQSTTLSQTLSFAARRGHRISGGFSLNITGLWAPGNSQVLKAGPAQFTQAIDNRGISLLSSATAPVFINGGVTYEYSFFPNLRWPSVHSSTIKVLKGQLPLTIATNSHIVRVGHLNSGKASINMSGIRIIFGKPTGVVQDPANSRLARCTVWVTVVANANAARWSMGQRFVQALSSGQSPLYRPTIGEVLGFESKSGRRLWCRVGQPINGPRWSCQIHIRGGVPATAWAKFRIRVARLHVPFVFHNVPIPRGAGANIQPAASTTPEPQPRPGPTSLIMTSAPTHRHGIGATKAEIARWIHQFSSPRANRRRLARRHLILAGGAAILQIQDALGHEANPALQRRFLSILDSIAVAGDLRGPLVSLHLRHASIQEVLAKLCEQAGVTPHDRTLPSRLLTTCNIQRQPFWRVLKRLSHLTGRGTIKSCGRRKKGGVT